MAYGNWGATVFCNGERRRDREDATPWREDQPSGYHQAFGIGVKNGVIAIDANLSAHHAVLGTGAVRLCGYKCYPALFVNGCEVKLTLEFPGDGERVSMGGSLHTGHEWRATMRTNFVNLYLRDPDGAVWTATCGYEYGAGFE